MDEAQRLSRTRQKLLLTAHVQAALLRGARAVGPSYFRKGAGGHADTSTPFARLPPAIWRREPPCRVSRCSADPADTETVRSRWEQRPWGKTSNVSSICSPLAARGTPPEQTGRADPYQSTTCTQKGVSLCCDASPGERPGVLLHGMLRRDSENLLMYEYINLSQASAFPSFLPAACSELEEPAVLDALRSYQRVQLTYGSEVIDTAYIPPRSSAFLLRCLLPLSSPGQRAHHSRQSVWISGHSFGRRSHQLLV